MTITVEIVGGGALQVGDALQLCRRKNYNYNIKDEFGNIVKTLAARHNITMPEQELLLEANKWELAHGGLSGRTAQQFIDYILGNYK